MALPFDETNLEAIWTKVLTEVGFAVAGTLKKALSLAIVGPNTLALRFSERYNTPGTPILETARLARLEEVLQKTTGQPCSVRIEFIKDEAAREAANGPAPPSPGQARQQRAELMQLPLVKKAVEALGAQFIKADDGFGAPVPTPSAEPPEEA